MNEVDSNRAAAATPAARILYPLRRDVATTRRSYASQNHASDPEIEKNERVFVLLFLLRCKEVYDDDDDDDDDDKLSQRREKGRFERLLEKSHCLPATASYASERKRIMQTFPLVRVMYPGPSSLMPREKGDSLPHCADSFPSAECRDDGRDEATQFHTSD